MTRRLQPIRDELGRVRTSFNGRLAPGESLVLGHLPGSDICVRATAGLRCGPVAHDCVYSYFPSGTGIRLLMLHDHNVELQLGYVNESGQFEAIPPQSPQPEQPSWQSDNLGDRQAIQSTKLQGFIFPQPSQTFAQKLGQFIKRLLCPRLWNRCGQGQVEHWPKVIWTAQSSNRKETQ